MRMLFKINELGENRREIGGTFTDDNNNIRTLKSTSTREFELGNQWAIELMLIFVEEDQLENLEVEVV